MRGIALWRLWIRHWSRRREPGCDGFDLRRGRIGDFGSLACVISGSGLRLSGSGLRISRDHGRRGGCLLRRIRIAAGGAFQQAMRPDAAPLTKNHEGPQLQGVYGRAAGGAAGFAYSAALRKARIVWDENSLDKWLANPDAFVPGNDMDFLVSGGRQRRDIIAYLKQTSGR